MFSKKTVQYIAMTGVMACSTAWAHNDSNEGLSFSNDSCEVDVNNHIRIKDEKITLINEQGAKLHFNQGGQVWLEQKSISVDPEQQKLVAKLAENILEAAPEAVDISLQSLVIASEAVGAVGKGLNMSAMTDLSEELLSQRDDMRKQYLAPGAFYFDSKEIEQELDGKFDESLEEYIEESVEKATLSMMGNVFMQVGKAMLGFDGGLKDFEKRMEDMGEEIEERVEAQVPELEAKAERLCLKALMIDLQETQLQETLPVWQDFDLVTAEHREKDDDKQRDTDSINVE